MFKGKSIAVGDVETNGLLEQLKHIWCICFKDIRTGEMFLYADDWSEVSEEFQTYRAGNLVEGCRHLSTFDIFACHNVLGFDWFALKSQYPNDFTLTWEQCWDTLIQSKMQWFDRPPVKGYKGNHGLAPWGARVGVRKPEVDDFTIGMCDIMAERVIEDVEINVKVFKKLQQERLSLENNGINMREAFRHEHLYRWNSTFNEVHGALFDKEAALAAIKEFTAIVGKLREEIEPQMPMYLEWESPKGTLVDVYKQLSILPREFGEGLSKEEFGKLPVGVKRELKRLRLFQGSLTSPKLSDYAVHPKLITKQVEKTRKGETKKYPIKNYAVPTTKIFNLNGKYDANVAKYWGLKPEDGLDKVNCLIGGAFSKVSWHKPKLSQHQKVKEFLLTQGWQPEEYNIHKIKGQMAKDINKKLVLNDGGTYQVETVNGVETITTPWSPKLTEDSYESITGELGKKIAEYNTYSHRIRFLKNPEDDTKGLLNLLREDGRLSCGVLAFNTSTGRASHSKWVNAPAADAVGGQGIRSAIIAPEGRVLVSTDMNSAQLSMAAYYANNYEYFKAVVDGNEYDHDDLYLGEDGHTYNAKAFGLLSEEECLASVGIHKHAVAKHIGQMRKKSKGCTFCVIFGGSGEKLGKMVGVAAAEGGRMKNDFLAKIGLDDVVELVAPQFKYGKGGKRTPVVAKNMPTKLQSPLKKKGWYIEIPFGYYVYCDMPHKAINYLIQGTEAACQKIAINYFNEKVKERGLDCFVIMDVHDEFTCESSIEDAEACGKLQEESYRYASDKMFEWHNERGRFFSERGFAIQLDSPHQKGMNYAEIH